MFEFLKEHDDETVGVFKTLINSCFDDSDKDDNDLVQELLHQVKDIKLEGQE